MKSTFIVLSLLVSIPTFAKDMSRTETYDESYRELEDGSNQYIGGCSVHQDYEDKMFRSTKTLVESFEPAYDEAEGLKEVKEAFKNIESELVMALSQSSTLAEAYEYMAGTDDISLEKIQSFKFKNLDLFRYNVGVGGGNGYYAIYARKVVKGKVSYDYIANIFDGDIEYCDESVWLKK